jgi:hypothetical protein
VPRRSKHPLLTGHTRHAPLVEIRHNLEMTVSIKEYETNHSAYEPVIICNRKQAHCSDGRNCEMMTLNDIHYNPAM